MAKGSGRAASALVLAAACQPPRAAGSAALVLAARGSAAGRIVGALLAAAPFAAAFCSGGWYVPQTHDECWHATGNNGKGYGGAGYGFSGNYGYGRGCYSYHSGGYSPYVYWSTSGNPLGGMDGGRYKVCGACFAGWYCPGNNYRYICPAGQYSGGGWSWCGTCAAGSYSGAGYSSCPACPAGTYSAAGAGSCTACPAGRYSTGGQANECLKCGDDGFWDQNGGASWDPTQQGLTSDDQCKCERGLTGANCELSECGGTTAAVSLGFLLLEVQWPRHARQLSRNEAFSGISAAFRAFDANSDNHLSVDEARAGIADGGMAVTSTSSVSSVSSTSAADAAIRARLRQQLQHDQQRAAVDAAVAVAKFRAASATQKLEGDGDEPHAVDGAELASGSEAHDQAAGASHADGEAAPAPPRS